MSPTSSVQSRAKSEGGGDDDDSVFDFTSPKSSSKQVVAIDDVINQGMPHDIDMESLNEALEDTPQETENESTLKGPVSPGKKTADTSPTLEQDKPSTQPETLQGQNRVVKKNDEGSESFDDSLSFSDAPGSFPRRGRRHQQLGKARVD